MKIPNVTIQQLLEAGVHLGYKTLAHKVLNAKEFGLPQNRERIFIVGFLDYFLFDFSEPLEN